MIAMVEGAGRLDTIKIKVTIAADEVGTALAAFNLSKSKAVNYEIYFCERSSQLGLLPLLDDAVLLRIRRHREGLDDVTVKLRPCRPGQVRGQWSAFRRSAHHELRIRGDWTHDRRVVAASLVHHVPDDRLRLILDSRPQDLGRLFSARQRRYLRECANVDLDLNDLCLLGPVEIRQWQWREPRYDVTAERWAVRIPGDQLELDLLELSVMAEPDDAALVQPAFLAAIRRRGLDPYASQQTKTRLVLQHLATPAPAQPM
jgi:hypothetical protein